MADDVPGEVLEFGDDVGQLETTFHDRIDEDVRRAVLRHSRQERGEFLPSRTGGQRPIDVRRVEEGEDGVGMEQETFVAIAHKEDGWQLDAVFLEEFEIEEDLDEHFGALRGIVQAFVQFIFAEQAQKHVPVQIAIALTGIDEDSAGEQNLEAGLVGFLNGAFVGGGGERLEEAATLFLVEFGGGGHGGRATLEEVAEDVGEDGAEEDDDGGGEDEEEEGEEHLGGGFVGEFLGALEAFLADLIGLDAEDGADGDAELIGLDEGGAEGSDLGDADAV